MSFDPNSSTIARCITQLREVQAEHSIDTKEILTSRDDVCRKLAYSTLNVENVPDGFTKTMLPVFFESATTLYISSGAPGTVVPEHSHDEGDGIRFMISGSIHYGDNELTEGDWMFIPAGAKYGFTVGPRGATMCYCYSCCCA